MDASCISCGQMFCYSTTFQIQPADDKAGWQIDDIRSLGGFPNSGTVPSFRLVNIILVVCVVTLTLALCPVLG